ncbi:unnamed protein product [Ranitomeya imitator]|uniref:MADF domain-containing protein n=1 Tax=Ranitomeya imitator TaxID=111125 RepID=A0ABN9LBG2_9NEOB|nr:unnamed protein product [Ranitomeya imitator]
MRGRGGPNARFARVASSGGKCNPGQVEKVPPHHLARPLYPLPEDPDRPHPDAAKWRFSIYPRGHRCVLRMVRIFSSEEPVGEDYCKETTFRNSVKIWGSRSDRDSGKVERLNRTLKDRMLKVAQETNKLRHETLPEAQKSCHLMKFCLGLVPDLDSVSSTHSLKPGDWVVVKKFVRRAYNPRFDGPFQVLLTTPTSVKDHPCIWDSRRESYHDRHMKERAWGDMAQSLIENHWQRADFKEQELLLKSIKTKWGSARDQLKRELKAKAKREREIWRG